MIYAHFIESVRGPIFILARIPEGTVNGCVLIVPPFAEEMNKTRPMFTRLGNLLAVNGIASVLLDLYGTGDSGGDFSDASWSVWQDDVVQVIKWCEFKRIPVTNLLAVRLGCSIVVGMANSERRPSLRSTILWQPLFDGKRALTQFLRIRTAASILANEKKETIVSLMSILDAGNKVEVGGYLLSGQLAKDMRNIIVPAYLPNNLGPVTWMEMVSQAETGLPSMSTSIIDKSRAAGVSVKAMSLVGGAFWVSTDVVCDSIIEASLMELKITGQA
jgi:exosortase A-associated hydrolase 2